jgi:hypothetical protein
MDDQQRAADIESLAKMAARLAGRNPDDHVKMKLGEVVGFEGPIWTYPDFVLRAEAAYELLNGPRRPISARSYRRRSLQHHWPWQQARSAERAVTVRAVRLSFGR